MAEPMIEEVFQDPRGKARLFLFTRAYAGARQSAQESRKRLREAAGLVPGFFQFRQWCLEDIKAAFHEDRLQGTRLARNRRLAWLHLFKYFARLHRIERALRISALDRQGNYSCELIDKTEPDRWGRLVHLAREFGIDERELLALAERPGPAKPQPATEPGRRAQP